MAKFLKTLQKICSNSAALHSSLQSSLSPSFPSPLHLSLTQHKEILSILSQLHSNDTLLTTFTSNSNFSKIFQDFKKNLSGIKHLLSANTQKVKKDALVISTILKEYKDRCQSTFLEFLKTLDGDLRKALKPLVPAKVLQDQLKFSPINPERLLSSVKSNPPEEEKHLDSTLDKLNNHIQLLINTLETVAKDLITITQNTNQKYYEIVDPLVLYSEPPSPLAAPLPDYFSYDLSTVLPQEAPYQPGIQLSDHTKRKILEKLKNISIGKDPACNPAQAARLHDKLQKIFVLGVAELDLLGCLKEEGVPVSDREKIVFDIIHTDRTSGMDVNIEDMILADELEKRGQMFEVSRNDYEDVLKNIEGKELTDRFEDRSQLGSLQSSIDEKVGKMSRKELNVRKKTFTPVVMSSESKLKSKEKISLGNVRLRNSTPNKMVQKNQNKRSHTPGVKKSKKK